jgi:hypothetical protein
LLRKQSGEGLEEVVSAVRIRDPLASIIGVKNIQKEVQETSSALSPHISSLK